MARLFISHSSRNNDKAIEVRDWLAANGWTDVFLDLDPERGIKAGQRWKDALQKAAHRCEVVLALVSPDWLASGWCKSEIDAAVLMRKKIIVALTRVDKSQVPLDLTDTQFIDLTGDPQAWVRLKEGLKHAGLDPVNFPFEADRRPYPGFTYFEEQDAAVFFGRAADRRRAHQAARDSAGRCQPHAGHPGCVGLRQIVLSARRAVAAPQGATTRHGCHSRSSGPSGR